VLDDKNSVFKWVKDSTHFDSGQLRRCVCSCGQCHASDMSAVGVVRGARSGRQYELICPDLPLAIHQDDVVHGRIDLAAARRREEAERKRLIAANQKPLRPAPKCDHGWPVRTHTFSDGKVLKLYGCGSSNRAEILNGRRTYGK
jgi:hypothetical protein